MKIPTLRRQDDIPHGVRVLTLATAVRWIGWGFGESLLPVFFLAFAHTYAEVGLLRAVYDIAFILVLPIAGLAADRLPATTLILLGLGLYTIVGAGYFLAGITGFVVFVLIARLTNGVTYALDIVGRETYFRRHVPQRAIATAFGYFDTVANFWWIVAALIGMILVRFFSIHALLFLITPTSLIAWVIVHRFRRQSVERTQPAFRVSNLRGAYAVAFREMRSWNLGLRGIAALNFFLSFAGTITAFFLPIEAYTQGASYTQIIFMGVLFTLPSLLGWKFGELFDTRGSSVFLSGLLGLAALVGSLAFVEVFAWRLFVAFGVGAILELLSVGSSELITTHARTEHYGRVGGIMKSLSDAGSLAGPLVIGILIDARGFSQSFLMLAVLLGMLAIVFSVTQRMRTHGGSVTSAGSP